MAHIRPFRAWRFTQKAGPMEQLICPPYDIISEEQRQAFLAKNPHNIIRLELPRSGEDPYAEAGGVLRQWIKEDILRQDQQAALYAYEIEFTVPHSAEPLTVAGLVAQVKLEPFSKGVVLPHEETLSKAKADRFELMKATDCNFSDIYSLYMNNGKIPAVSDLVAGQQPIIEVTDQDGLVHRMWAITDPAVTGAVCDAFADTKLYIADGHHRYETALNYRDYLLQTGQPVGDADYVMMMLVDMDHPGLVVFPTHRMVRGLKDFDAPSLLAACSEEFDIQTGLPVEGIQPALDGAYRRGQKAFALYTGGDTFTLLTLKDVSVMDQYLPQCSPASRQLDINVLHTLVLERVLGIDKENMAKQINLTYTRSLEEALEQVRAGGYQASFILNPTRVSEIREVATAGEKMPQKSTYFYPKLITGLTINKLR